MSNDIEIKSNLDFDMKLTSISIGELEFSSFDDENNIKWLKSPHSIIPMSSIEYVEIHNNYVFGIKVGSKIVAKIKPKTMITNFINTEDSFITLVTLSDEIDKTIQIDCINAIAKLMEFHK